MAVESPKIWGIPDPKKKNGVKDIKSKLLNPALTSLYYVNIGGPTNFDKFLRANMGRMDKEGLQLMCCEATLPGSSLATLELTNDRTGVTERHAYRRVYDDRIDLTFYVDAQNYAPIRYFETWIKYIASESIAKQEGDVGTEDPNYHYRMRFPDDYVDKQGLAVIKFEKSSVGNHQVGRERGGTLIYRFLRAFPISISSMPVSYDSSSLLKCTVSLSYVRYIVDKTEPPNPAPGSNNTIPPQAIPLGSSAFTDPRFKDLDFGIDTTGLNFPTAWDQSKMNSNAFSAYFQPQSTTDRQPTPTELRQGVFRNADGTIRR